VLESVFWAYFILQTIFEPVKFDNYGSGNHVFDLLASDVAPRPGDQWWWGVGAVIFAALALIRQWGTFSQDQGKGPLLPRSAFMLVLLCESFCYQCYFLGPSKVAYQIPIYTLLVCDHACLLLRVCASLAVCLFACWCANALLTCLLPTRLVFQNGLLGWWLMLLLFYLRCAWFRMDFWFGVIWLVKEHQFANVPWHREEMMISSSLFTASSNVWLCFDLIPTTLHYRFVAYSLPITK
jgi:hypothetical protein